MVGRSGKRKKLSSYTSRAPSEAQTQHYAKLRQIEERLARDGIALEVGASWKWQRLYWAMGVSLVAPLEVRNEQELAQVARLARALILQKTSLTREFPGFVYDRACSESIKIHRENCVSPFSIASVSLAVEGVQNFV